VLDEAGYSGSTWIDRGVPTAELAKLLGDGGPIGKRSRLFTVELMPAPSGFRPPVAGRSSMARRTPVMSMRELRERVGRTQGDVARRIAMTQPQLSRVEARSDHLTSTLRKFVRALGGRVEIVAHLKKGARVVLRGV
jgi:hypothetical protein